MQQRKSPIMFFYPLSVFKRCVEMQLYLQQTNIVDGYVIKSLTVECLYNDAIFAATA